MTIITIAQVEYRADQGFNEPGLPTAIWRVSERAIGDVSGGLNILQINLKGQVEPVGEFFSLEELNLENETIGGDAPILGLEGMEVWGPGLIIRRWAIPDVEVVGGSDHMVELRRAHPKLFIGRAAGNTTSGTISVTVVNTNTEDLVVAMAGYVWSPRSILTPGGIRRPMSGMFPN